MESITLFCVQLATVYAQKSYIRLVSNGIYNQGIIKFLLTPIATKNCGEENMLISLVSTIISLNSIIQVTLKDLQLHGHSTSSDQDLETVFSLSPVAHMEGNILFESQARIYHLATKTWLHMDKSECVLLYNNI